MDELVTVIIPVYNKCRQIERCVDSVTNQTYTALEILLIDDGSTDGSGKICDEFAEKDSRITVIHQTNGGVSAARNTGLRAMSGVWLAFVDADDFVSPYYLEDLFAAAHNGCDMSLCHCLYVPDDPDESSTAFSRLADVEFITGYEASIRHFSNHTLYISCWGKLFRATLWESLFFPEGKIGEDLFVSHSLLYRSKSIAITDAILYAYVQSEGSIVRSEFTVQRFDALDSWEEGVRVYSAAGDTDLSSIAKRVYCSRVFDAWHICKNMLSHEHETLQQLRLRSIKAYCGVKHVRNYIDCSHFKALTYRLLFFLGRWCLPLYGFLFVRNKWRSRI